MRSIFCRKMLFGHNLKNILLNMTEHFGFYLYLFQFFNCRIHCMYENLIICQTMFMCWLKYFCCCSKAGEFFHHIYKKYILRKVQAIIWILFHIYLLLTVGPLITLTPLSIYKSKVPHWSSQHLTWLLNNNRCIYFYNVAVRKTWKCFSQKLLQKLVLKLPKSILKRNTLQQTCIFKKMTFVSTVVIGLIQYVVQF